MSALLGEEGGAVAPGVEQPRRGRHRAGDEDAGDHEQDDRLADLHQRRLAEGAGGHRVDVHQQEERCGDGGIERDAKDAAHGRLQVKRQWGELRAGCTRPRPPRLKPEQPAPRAVAKLSQHGAGDHAASHHFAADNRAGLPASGGGRRRKALPPRGNWKSGFHFMS